MPPGVRPYIWLVIRQICFAGHLERSAGLVGLVLVSAIITAIYLFFVVLYELAAANRANRQAVGIRGRGR